MKAMSGLENLEFESATSYLILEELGRGGMGIVYLAERRCLGIGDLVVLKTIRNSSPATIDGLRREATIATRLRHDNIVRTFGLESIPYSALPMDLVMALEQPVDVGSKSDYRSTFRTRSRMGRRRDETPRASLHIGRTTAPTSGGRQLALLVMDYVEGVDLRTLLDQHTAAGLLLPVALGAYIVCQICRALSHAHRHIIHRDISPDNILINTHGTPKLTDFGVAINPDEEVLKVAGKPLYIAPECYTTGAVDERSDIFSLGVCFYQVLTGVKPILLAPGEGIALSLARARHQLEQGVTPPREIRPDVPEVLSDTVMRMMAMDPSDRFSRSGMIADRIDQEYLYARGVGPTNHSLAAYIRFFESGFLETDTDDITQLGFLRDEAGRLNVKRAYPTAAGVDSGAMTVSGSITAPPPAASTASAVPAHDLIRIRVGEGLIASFSDLSEPLTIGSAADNRCVVSGTGVTAHHARVLSKGPEVVVERCDLDAGIQVNQLSVVRVRLFDGDRIRFRSVPATFYNEVPPEPCRRTIEAKEGAELDVPEAADLLEPIEIRFAGTPEGIDITCRMVEEVYGSVDFTPRRRAEFLEGVGRALHATVGPGRSRMALRVYPVRSRIHLDLVELDPCGRLAGYFDALVRRPKSRPPRGIDQLEFRSPEGILRLTVEVD